MGCVTLSHQLASSPAAETGKQSSYSTREIRLAVAMYIVCSIVVLLVIRCSHV